MSWSVEQAWIRSPLLRLFIFKLLAAVSLCAADAPLPADVEHVIGLARALPAPFAADLLIRVAALPQLQGNPRQRELLEDAFALAYWVEQALPRKAWPPAPPGSVEAILEQADQLGLDTLSLQARAAHALGDDVWIERLPAPPAAPLSCNDRFLWDTSPYWRLLAARKVFPPRPILSLVEVGPAIEMIERRNPAPDELERLTAWLLDGLERLPEDDRAFTATLRTTTRSLENLAILRRRHQLSADPVLAALARLLSRNHAAPRCVDTLERTQPVLEALVWYFNDLLRKPGHLASAALPPLEIDSSPTHLLRESAATREHVADPDWLKEYRRLLNPAPALSVADSKLFELQPLVWFLLARDIDDPHSPHPVIAAYSRLRALYR